MSFTQQFPLHDLNSTEFEDLIVLICRKIFGVGVTSFSPGKDGGRDAQFNGTPNSFPSDVGQEAGKFVIQAKHTSNFLSCCSENDFCDNKTSIISKEIPKIQKMFNDGNLTHYVIFTNRNKTGGADQKVVKKIQDETGLQKVWLRAKDDILHELRAAPEIVKLSALEKFKSPLRFTPEDMNRVIVAFYNRIFNASALVGNQYDFSYPGLDAKNTINGLSQSYYNECVKDSEVYFFDIRNFLQNPRNIAISEHYRAVADDLKSQLILNSSNFPTFDAVLESVYGSIIDQCSEIQQPTLRRLVRVFVHYMYVNCDIGKKS